MAVVVRILLALVGLVVSAQVARRLARHAPFDVATSREAVPVQSALFAPDRLIRRLPLEPGMRVLLLGPAPDSLMTRVARGVGKYGKVYVLQPSPESARRLDADLRERHLANVDALVGQASHLNVPDATFDLVLAVGQLAGLPRRQRALWEIERILRPGGHLSVSQALLGPTFLRGETLRREAGAVGLAWREQHGLPFAYTANFRKPA
ncbi:MAG TPA: methyltransferase domain-containing protein [Chloroflexota bacterium]|nr:methyltransferase domain-containing protein [Chloroflexota bacterium]